MNIVWLIVILGIVIVVAAFRARAKSRSLNAIGNGRGDLKTDPASAVSSASPASPISPSATAGIGPEIVAVIAAAVAAASGATPGSFQIASIAPTQDAGGFNTPVWGRIERLIRN